jgi:hypothetical protein
MNANLEAGVCFEIVRAGRKKAASRIVNLGLPERDALVAERRLQRGEFRRVGTAPKNFE